MQIIIKNNIMKVKYFKILIINKTIKQVKIGVLPMLKLEERNRLKKQMTIMKMKINNLKIFLINQNINWLQIDFTAVVIGRKFKLSMKKLIQEKKIINHHKNR